MIAILIKNNDLSDENGNLLVNGKIYKPKNLINECKKQNIKTLIAKKLNSSLISELRKNGIIFLKLNSIDEIKNLSLDIILPSDFPIKRGWGCSKEFLKAKNE